MIEKKSGLAVNTEVLEKMVELAAKEIDGVAGLVKRSVDLKSAVKSGNAVKGVKVESINGAVQISVYLCVKPNTKVYEVAEAVQSNVKDKVQTMTGAAVTKVNVIVVDIAPEEETKE